MEGNLSLYLERDHSNSSQEGKEPVPFSGANCKGVAFNVDIAVAYPKTNLTLTGVAQNKETVLKSLYTTIQA